MRLKETVKLNNLTPQIIIGLLVAKDVYDSHNIEFVITSANDSTHGANSLHYQGNAIDLRTKNIPSNLGAILISQEIRNKLTKDFDVMLESIGKENEHIHVEYDPKE